jgi:hypothetical protein
VVEAFILDEDSLFDPTRDATNTAYQVVQEKQIRCSELNLPLSTARGSEGEGQR